MDILQIVLGVLAVFGIIVVGVLAIVPTVMDIPRPTHPRQHREPEHQNDVHLAA
ncbi:MAG TPA: hypothetical protein VIP98_22700 [Microlunatus sp.]